MQADNNNLPRVDSQKSKRINKKRVVWQDVSNKTKILQVYNKGLEYCLLSSNYEQCHQFVWCKDFLHDVVQSSLHNKKFEIYKFNYDPPHDPNPCIREIRIAVANSCDAKLGKKILSCVDFINQIELKLNIPLTKVRICLNPLECYKKSGVFIFQGNKRWINSPPMLSLFSLLIRVGFSHSKGQEYQKTIRSLKNGFFKPYQKKDARWINEIEPALHKIIRIGDRKIFYKDIKLNYPASINIDAMHNRMGIVGFACDLIAKNAGQSVTMPYWHLIK